MVTGHKNWARSRLRPGVETLEDRVVLSATLATVPAHTADVTAASVSSDSMKVEYQASVASVPNDAQFRDQWALNNTAQGGTDLNATAAWDVTKGSTKMVVSVMDTGIDYTHPDLYLNIWLNQGEIPASIRSKLIDTDGDGLISFRDLNDKRNQGAGKITDRDGDGRITGADLLKSVGQGGWADGSDTDGNGYADDLIGWNFADNTNDPMDKHGHGTHVAGTIGAVGNNGVGVTGVNWNVRLMPIKFISDSHGTLTEFISGLNYAVKMGAKVSNNSWIGAAGSDALSAAIDAARAKGHILVCAAGNAGENNDRNPNYPASYWQDNIVSVAAVNRDGSLAGYSNYGANTVDVAAPGSDILSTLPGGQYGTKSGTSMATPNVTGVIALVWGQHPEWSYQQVIAQVLNTSTHTTALTGKVKKGEVNAAAAVGAVQVASSAPRIINAVSINGSAYNLNTIRLSFDRAMNASTFTASDIVLKGPDGKAIAVTVKAVAGYSGNVFDVSFAAQTTPGNYSLTVGPAVKDTNGKDMTLYANKIFTLAAAPAPLTLTNAVSIYGSAYNLNTIRLSFDRAVNASTFTASDIVLTGPDGKAIAVTVKAVAGYSGNVFDVTFAAQSKTGTYTLKVGPAISDTKGVAMNALASRTFTLAAAPAPLTLTNAVSIYGSAYNLNTIRLSFDRAVNASTFTASDIVLTGPDGKAIAVTVKAVAGYSGNVFDVTFAAQSKTGTYTLKVGPAISDTKGVAMNALASRTFTLAAAPAPLTLTNAVSIYGSAYNLNTIRLSFDRAVNASTFTASDIVLTGPDGKAIAVTVKAVAGYSGNVFDVTFAAQSKTGTYTLKVGPAISDTKGVAMNALASRTFTLAAAPAPLTLTNAVSIYGSAYNLNTIRLSFDRAVNASTFTASDIVLTGPDGKAIAVTVKAVAGYSGNVFDVTFAAQSKTGTYTLKVGPAISDTKGVAMNAAHTRTFAVQASATSTKKMVMTTSFVGRDDVNIVPRGRGVSMINVNQSAAIDRIIVEVNITHPRVSDLYVTLEAPDGTTVVLLNQVGGNAANFIDTSLDDHASASIGTNRTTIYGTFLPSSPLSAFTGKQAAGTWKLWVQDRAGLRAGTLTEWSMLITPKA